MSSKFVQRLVKMVFVDRSTLTFSIRTDSVGVGLASYLLNNHVQSFDLTDNEVYFKGKISFAPGQTSGEVKLTFQEVETNVVVKIVKVTTYVDSSVAARDTADVDGNLQNYVKTLNLSDPRINQVNFEFEYKEGQIFSTVDKVLA